MASEAGKRKARIQRRGCSGLPKSLSGRIWKKTVGKSSWFRKKKRKRGEEKPAYSDVVDKAKESTTRKSFKEVNTKTSISNSKHQEEENKSRKEEPRTAAVMFVNNTKDGLLAKNIREVVERLKYILGYKIKIVERAGTSLKQMFPLTRIGEN